MWQHVPPMAFSLSFADDFYVPEDLDSVEPTQQPTSVYEAILGIREEQWKEMCRELFKCEPENVDADMVMSKIRETNTCTDLTPPVEVWIDEERWYTVDVYDELRDIASSFA